MGGFLVQQGATVLCAHAGQATATAPNPRLLVAGSPTIQLAALLPAETLRLRRGACRDVAVLLAETLRASGLAARLVSGYLRETDAESRRAEGSLHAWTEVYLPGAGWVGMDGTNGVFCNHNFIGAAVGLCPADITPVSGSYYYDGKIASEMTSRLELLQL